MKRLVEFRSYKLKPGAAAALARQDAFYNSPDWVDGPRADIVPLVQGYLNTLVWMSQESIDDLRKLNSGT